MKYLAILVLALSPLAAGCSRSAEADANPARMESVAMDGDVRDKETLIPGMAALDGDNMSIVPRTAPGLWRISVSRDSKKTGGQEVCRRALGVKELMNAYGHPPACTKRTFKKRSAEAYTYKATCDMFGEDYLIDNRISGDMTTHYVLELNRTKSSMSKGTRFENIVVTAERVGDCPAGS